MHRSKVRVAVIDSDSDDEPKMATGTMKIFTGGDTFYAGRERVPEVPYDPYCLTRPRMRENIRRIISAPEGINAFYYMGVFNFQWFEGDDWFTISHDTCNPNSEGGMLQLKKCKISNCTKEETVELRAPPGMTIADIKSIVYNE